MAHSFASRLREWPEWGCPRSPCGRRASSGAAARHHRAVDIFTRAQWHAGGRSRRALEQALADGSARRVLRGVYAWCDVPDVPENRARAIHLLRPQHTVVARTVAAWLSGVDVLPPGRSIAEESVHLMVDLDTTPPRISGCRASQAELPESDLVEEYGVVRTGDARTALDLARFAPRGQAVASVDAFLNDDRVTLADLWARTRPLTKVRNCRRLRANLAVADAGAQSYAESVQRVLYVDAGMPRPTTQIPVYTLAGELLGFLDMGWLRYRLASEYDGEEHHDSDADRVADSLRRDRITGEGGWSVEVVRKQELWGRPAALVARTSELLLARGWTPPNSLVLDQIAQAARYGATTGQRWQWLPLERLLAA